MILNITKDIVKIINLTAIDGEILGENILFHNILIFLLKKLKENRKNQCFYIDKSKILPFFSEVSKISKNFPFYIIISTELPVENDEFTCILHKYANKYHYNTRKFYKFLKKYKLTSLEQAYINENLRFTMYNPMV